MARGRAGLVVPCETARMGGPAVMGVLSLLRGWATNPGHSSCPSLFGWFWEPGKPALQDRFRF